MHITKRLVDAMEGEIYVESELGKGSVFTVRLPQKRIGDAVCGAGLTEQLNRSRFKSTLKMNRAQIVHEFMPYGKVLVVDDVESNLYVARGMLAPYGLKVETVTNGSDAVDKIKEGNIYDIILMDHMMPVMDGIEAVRIIREEIGTDYAKTVPIIAFTANALIGDEDLFLGKGFQAYIAKPVNVARLDAVIREWVRNDELEKSMADKLIVVEGEPVFDNRTGSERRSDRGDRRKGLDRRLLARKVEGVDINKGLDRFSGDWETLLQVMKSFIVNTKPVLDTIKEVNVENLPDYAIIVHGVKSSCRGISAETAGSQAEALEKAAKAGDFDFVQKNNQALIDIIAKLINDLDEALHEEETTVKTEKPKIDKPYKEALLKLKNACNNYAINEIDKIMNEIEVFDYESDENLVSWLRENVDQMNYLEIAERLPA
jgi:CheY-like chemotaxis protein